MFDKRRKRLFTDAIRGTAVLLGCMLLLSDTDSNVFWWSIGSVLIAIGVFRKG